MHSRVRRHRGAMQGQGTSTRFPARPFPVIPYGGPEAMFGEFGLSLKPSRKIKAAAKKVGRALDSKVTRAVVGVTLAATGVGAPAAAAIMGAQRVAGKGLQGAKLRTIAKAGAVGAATGAAASVAGKVLPKVPGLRRPIAALRRKVGTAPALPPSVPQSVPNADVVDRLASGPIPSVGVTPTGMSVETYNEVKDAQREARARKSAEAVRIATAEATTLTREAAEATRKETEATTPEERSTWRRRAADLLKKSAAKVVQAKAQNILESAAESPVSAPMPTGGYGQADAAPSGMSPMMLAALGIGAVLLLSRK